MLTSPDVDFWPTSGYRLLAVDANGHLTVTDDFLRHLLSRPELAPIADSCPAEVALHDQLLAAPRCEVTEATLATLKDRDAADNYAVWLRFRARLLAGPTLEASYLALFQGDGVDVAPVLVQQLTQILLRHVLGGKASALNTGIARAHGDILVGLDADTVFAPDAIALITFDQSKIIVPDLVAGGFDGYRRGGIGQLCRYR